MKYNSKSIFFTSQNAFWKFNIDALHICSKINKQYHTVSEILAITGLGNGLSLIQRLAVDMINWTNVDLQYIEC